MGERNDIGRADGLVSLVAEQRPSVTFTICPFTPTESVNTGETRVILHSILLPLHILIEQSFKLLAQCGHSLVREYGIRQLHFLLCRAKGVLKTYGCHFPTIACPHPYREPCLEKHCGLVCRRKVKLNEDGRIIVVGLKELSYGIILEKISVGHILFKYVLQSSLKCYGFWELVVEGNFFSHA